MDRFEYSVVLTAAPEGGFVVTCRDLPQLITQGENQADALAQAADAMDEAFATYMQNNMTFPAPSTIEPGEYWVAPPAQTIAKAALFCAMRSAGMTKVQLANKMGIDEKEVRRLLDPHYASKLPRIAQAIGTLGKRLVIGLEAA